MFQHFDHCSLVVNDHQQKQVVQHFDRCSLVVNDHQQKQVVQHFDRCSLVVNDHKQKPVNLNVVVDCDWKFEFTCSH